MNICVLERCCGRGNLPSIPLANSMVFDHLESGAKKMQVESQTLSVRVLCWDNLLYIYIHICYVQT